MSANPIALPLAGAVAADLVSRAQRGDLAAFEQVIRLHERQVLRTALRILGNSADAEDAAQEVFLRLHKHLAGFRQGEEFGPWLYRVTVNVCRDLARKRGLHHGEELDQEPTSEAPSAERQAAGRELRERLEAALQQLPPKERTAVVLREIEGLDTSEVAQLLGSSETTVRSQISMAKAKLRRWLGGMR